MPRFPPILSETPESSHPLHDRPNPKMLLRSVMWDPIYDEWIVSLIKVLNKSISVSEEILFLVPR